VAEGNVLCNSKDGNKHEVLMHHSDSGRHRVAWSGEVLLDAVDFNMSLIGGVETVENVHQRGLASAIFAQQSMNLTGFNN